VAATTPPISLDTISIETLAIGLIGTWPFA
jgi:hypothetical protein